MFSKKYLFLSSEIMSDDKMINLLTLTPKSYVDSTYQCPHLNPSRLA